ncbi:sigma-54 interaction domain-containing protein [Scopulibacillus cellulosilyticus]|uniref:HTH-type transcriptional regulatory protein TyrR n=1 Tax=Scopulibacillus cellulosilyticus TaxID=2665665 RepID=A0ABW2PWX3_9BACL
MVKNQHESDLINAELNDIFEASFDEIFVTDQHGVVIRVNAMCKKNYRLPAHEIVGKHVQELEAKGVFYPSASLEVIRTKKPLELFQNTAYGRYLHVQARPVFDRNGDLKRVVSYSRDLTELIQLKKKIEDMEERLENYKKEINDSAEFEGLIAKSSSMKKILALVQKVAKADSTVLLLGETGVGKGEIVKRIHHHSNRRQQTLYEVNCAALPEHLVEAELFGYEPGSFTGALREGKKGLFELANKSTLFLDEVAELPLHIQSKLLQALQEKKIRRIGGKEAIPVDVRVIAATNSDLEEMIKKGTFRKDLYYRLNVIPIYIPPLRERKEDILPLVYHFIEYFNFKYNCSVQLSPKALEALLDYKWEGNIRELENMVERLVVTADGIVTVKDLPAPVKAKSEDMSGKTLNNILEEVEKSIILDAYDKYGSTYKVAQELGISQSQASRKVKKYLNQ